MLALLQKQQDRGPELLFARASLGLHALLSSPGSATTLDLFLCLHLVPIVCSTLNARRARVLANRQKFFVGIAARCVVALFVRVLSLSIQSSLASLRRLLTTAKLIRHRPGQWRLAEERPQPLLLKACLSLTCSRVCMRSS